MGHMDGRGDATDPTSRRSARRRSRRGRTSLAIPDEARRSEPVVRLRDRWVTVDGLRLYARAFAVSPAAALPVVLVHGAFISSRYMVPVAARLAPRYAVYAPDLPGYGKSERPARMPSIDGFADILARWMDALGLARAAFIGNSSGCQVVAALAARHPARVARAILVGPTVEPARRGLAQQGARLLLDGAREPARYLPLLLGDCLRLGPLRGAQLARAVLRDRIEVNLPRLRAPTLVVRGEDDPLAPQRWADEATRLLPAARLAVIPGVAHVAHFDAPDAFVRLARPFLDAAGPSPVA